MKDIEYSKLLTKIETINDERDALSIAYNIYFISQIYNNEKTNIIINNYIIKLNEFNIENLLQLQARFIYNIIEFGGLYYYEEIVKVYLLSQDFYGLVFLTGNENNNILIKLEESLIFFLRKERKNASIVKSGFRDEVNKNFWFYNRF